MAQGRGQNDQPHCISGPQVLCTEIVTLTPGGKWLHCPVHGGYYGSCKGCEAGVSVYVASTPCRVAFWLNEDELRGLTVEMYDAWFPHSEIRDGVRMFPCYLPCEVRP